MDITDDIKFIRQSPQGQTLANILKTRYAALETRIMAYHPGARMTTEMLESTIARAQEIDGIIKLLDDPETEIDKYYGSSGDN